MAASHTDHQHHQQQSPSQTLPSITSLTNGLSNGNQYSPQNRQPSHLPSRDSGTWPHPQMKPVTDSSLNNQPLQVSTLLNPDESYSRNSIPSTPTSARLSQQMPSTTLPSINQAFDNGNQNRGSVDYHPSIDSRRSSIDSRVHTGLTNLGLNNPASPYDSQNASQVSLAASLRRPNNQPPMSPLSSRHSVRSSSQHGPRIAPPIVGAARVPGGPDPMAAKPTPGYSWAFPDSAIPEEQRRESSSDESTRYDMSRQNSLAASSIRSSIFSTESGLPHGQRRFDDDVQTHHHSMQHRSVSALQNEGGIPGAGGNYSRTPELRISHKLAERKRRSEMKDLFEDLNRAVPTNGGAKASKWEILTKAIEYIKNTQAQERSLHSELSRLRAESDYARESHKEIEMLQTEINVMHERLRRLDPGTNHIYGQHTSRLNASMSQNNGQPHQYSLPALNSAPPQGHYGAPMGPPGGAMQGVEYGGPARLR